MKTKLLLIVFAICLLVSMVSKAQFISGGFEHVLAICNNGTLQAWGKNLKGQLGNGTTTQSGCYCIPTPGQVDSLTGIIAISAGYDFSIVLKSDSTVWAWGNNIVGQLGNGTNIDSPTPVQVSSLTGVIAIAAGDGHCLALKSDSTVWSWGGNNFGQLGDSTTTNRSTPVLVHTISGISSISAGSHSLALKSDGTVWAWGTNFDGELGDGTIQYKSSPVQVNNLTGIISVVAAIGSSGNSLAVKNDGTVWAWGENMYGQLGIGTSDNSPHTAPVQSNVVTGIIAVAAGQRHSMALKNDGSIYAWGSNSWGMLGNGSLSLASFNPILINTISGIYQIACTGGNCIALKNDGTLWMSGGNGRGELGIGTADALNHTPYLQSTGVCVLPVGTEEQFSEIYFLVHPNPSNGKFLFETKDMLSSIVSVYNMMGEKLFEQKIVLEKTDIDLSNQSNGIYFVTVRGEKNNLVTKKIVKM